MKDSKGPDQVCIAPAATTDYLEGDTVRFSVIYDEVLATVSDPTVNVNAFSAYMPIKEGTVKYIGGQGTNVLVFEGKASKNFSNTTWPGGTKPDGTSYGASGTNEEMLKVTNAVNGGTVKDMTGH